MKRKLFISILIIISIGIFVFKYENLNAPETPSEKEICSFKDKKTIYIKDSFKLTDTGNANVEGYISIDKDDSNILYLSKVSFEDSKSLEATALIQDELQKISGKWLSYSKDDISNSWNQYIQTTTSEISKYQACKSENSPPIEKISNLRDQASGFLLYLFEGT